MGDVFDLGVTDHCFLVLKFSKRSIKTKDSLFDHNAIKYKTDYDTVKSKLKNINWSEVFAENDVNLCYDRFHEILNNVIINSNKIVALDCKLRKAKLLSPWITSKLLKKIEKRKKLYKIFKRRPYDTGFIAYFTKFSKNLKLEIDLVKNNYYANKLENCNGDVSQQWKIINDLTGCGKDKPIDQIELDNGTVITEPYEIAQEINKHLISVGLQSGQQGTTSTETLPICVQANSFFIIPTTIDEIISVVYGLKNKKSSGFDKINVCLLKHIIVEIAPVLVYIINKSFIKGIFPESLKLSSVVPILKKPNSFKLDNIRPISLLSVFSKLIEKLMLLRLTSFLNKSNFFSDNQFGFIKGRSTESALLNVTEYIFNGINSKQKTTGVFIDFKKAYDMVNHAILINKLEAAGIRGIALKWFHSFITGRKQQVKINNIHSDELIVRTGVPQGSTISATLFLIFINDLLEPNFKGNINAFADDIALFYTQKDSVLLSNLINCDLLLLKVWCSINKMQVNVSKTKFINFDFFGFDLPSPLIFYSASCNIQLCACQPLEKVSSIKYLGVILDERLTFEPHTLEVHSKLRSQIRTFYFLRNFCSTSLLRTLYFALINSRLQYALPCWGGTYRTFIDKIRITQNFFLRIILKKSRQTSSFPLYQQLRILPIRHLFIFKVLRLFFIRSGNRETIMPSHTYSTRSFSNKYFKLPKVNKTIFRHSFHYLGPKIFNQLPLQIKNSTNIKEFCKKAITWLYVQQDIEYLTDQLV